MSTWMRLLQIILISTAMAGTLPFPAANASPASADGKGWVPALDSLRVQRSGAWRHDQFRYAKTTCLSTRETGAALTFEFTGSGVALGLGQPGVPAYGGPRLGKVIVTVDDGSPRLLYPAEEAREVVLARGLSHGEHRVRVVHQPEAGEAGCRISGFRVLAEDSGDLSLHLHGEENAFFVDARAVVRRDGEMVRNVLVRNWLTGACRLTGLAAGTGYSLELIAFGWEPRRIDGIAIREGEETRLPPVYLRRQPRTAARGIRFPALGYPAIRRPGESFRVRTASYGTPVDEVKLSRQVGPAAISRALPFEEDPEAAYYYDREHTVTLPPDMPPGLYDLWVWVGGSRGRWERRSPASVYVVREYPEDPVFMTFGHLDTQGQYQAEFERRLAQIANLIAPDMVLISNSVNPAYISGAHQALRVPYAINFGNHQFYGHERWYGDPVGMIDYGPDLCILNFGHAWHVDLSKAEALMASRADARIKVINAYEPNAPVESFLNRYQVPLIHDGHGPPPKVTSIGSTPTIRAGKVSSESFRVVRFEDGRVASLTYLGDDVAAIPFPREGPAPLEVAWDPANDGTHDRVTATVTNRLEEAFPDGRVTFVLPAGEYSVEGGRLETAVASDDGRYTVLTARLDIPAEGIVRATARNEPGR